MFEPYDGNPAHRPASADPERQIEILEWIARQALDAYEKTCQPFARVRRTSGRVARDRRGNIVHLPDQEVREIVPAKSDRRFLSVARRALADADELRAMLDAVRQRSSDARRRAHAANRELDLPLDLLLFPQLDVPGGSNKSRCRTR